MRLLVAVSAFAALAGPACAQPADRARGDPGASQAAPRGGTVTNPPVSGGASDDPGAPATGHDAPPAHAVEPDVHHGDITVRQQAEEKRRQALEQCQSLSGASRTECVKRADADYRRAISEDTLSDRGPGPRPG